MGIVIAIVVVVVILGAFIFLYNGLVKRRARTSEAWSQIDVELKRRHDLIPNLVATVQGYATHEKGTFEAVTNARANAISAQQTGDPAKVAGAENVLSGALKSLFAVAENYPALRAVESFSQLQEQLTGTEDKIEFARRYYNTSARDYNIALQTFPRSLVAGMFGFKGVTFFEAADGDREVPVVDFNAKPSGPDVASEAGPPAA
jgi:LemA protein